MFSNFAKTLPDVFKRNVFNLCKEEGELWLNDLPNVISSLEEKWEIKVDSHFPNLSYNYVASCYQKDKTAAVLKIALPLKDPEIFGEAKFLQMFEDKGAVKFLKFDKAYRAMLIEKLAPGRHLKEVFANNKEKSVEIAIKLMKQLYESSFKNKHFSDVDYWLVKLEEQEKFVKNSFAKNYFDKACKVFEDINSNKNKVILLHGDLHHENILSVGQSDFKVIDPSAINANIGYEIGVFLRNHAKWVKEINSLRIAVQQFADAFEFSTKQVKQWAYFQQVISACWDFEYNGKHWRRELEAADMWEEV